MKPCNPLKWAADRAWYWLANRLIPLELNDVEFEEDDVIG